MSFIRLAPEQYDTIPEIAEPAENPFLFGHEEAVRHVADAYRSGKLHHGLLLGGPPGIGKATFAFHLAHHLLSNPVPENAPETFSPPDPDTALFRQIAQGSHPAILHLTRPFNEKTKSFKTVVTVEEIRKVTRFLSMTSHDGGYRVVIVDPADDMNVNAANALLKTLEEPPARTLFVLISHSLGALLPTIRSRCQTVKLKPLPPKVLLQALRSLNAEMPETEAAINALAERAGGSVRDALLLTQYGGLDIAQVVSDTVSAKAFAVASASRIADAVGGKDNAVQFAIFNQTVLDLIARKAHIAATQNELATAHRYSEFWRETDRMILETDTYNLEKRQHVMGLLRRMWQISNS